MNSKSIHIQTGIQIMFIIMSAESFSNETLNIICVILSILIIFHMRIHIFSKIFHTIYYNLNPSLPTNLHAYRLAFGRFTFYVEIGNVNI